jgi:kynurenine formamidase
MDMSRIIDLTVSLETNMPAHRHFQRPVILPHFTHQNSAAMGLGAGGDILTSATTFLAMVDHVGTHVDSFFHTSPSGQTIDEMPIEMFMGKAVCLDLTHIPDLGDIDVEDLEAAERKAGVRIDGHIVLLNTGLHKRHFPDEKVMLSNPGVTAAATHWLADRGSRVHGVEGPSTDKPTETGYPNHRVCRDRAITHYEWLCNLEELVGQGVFQFHGLPLKIKKGAGGPARAIAIVD